MLCFEGDMRFSGLPSLNGAARVLCTFPSPPPPIHPGMVESAAHELVVRHLAPLVAAETHRCRAAGEAAAARRSADAALVPGDAQRIETLFNTHATSVSAVC